MNKLLVFGSEGMLGRYFCRYFKQSSDLQVVGLTRNDFDAITGTVQQLRALLQSHYVDTNTVVFNAVGVIPQAQSQNQEQPFPGSAYYLVNFNFSVTLSRVVREFGARLVYPATDCVFSGQIGNYDENGCADDESEYGNSKRMGENIKGTVIRVSIIGENPKGISLLEWAKSQRGQTVLGYTNHYWNGITCLEYAKYVHRLIVSSGWWEGVRHVYSPQVVSKAELLELINQTYELDLTVAPFQTEQKCDRSLSSKYPELSHCIPDLATQLTELRAFGM
jgi:dTDP-4-dehydrorhamnose reductase